MLGAALQGRGGSDKRSAAVPNESRPATPRDEKLPEHLTRRERQVLTCVAEGLATKEIAYRLSIAFKTAACHRYRIMEKLEIHNTAGLVRYAINSGLVAP